MAGPNGPRRPAARRSGGYQSGIGTAVTSKPGGPMVTLGGGGSKAKPKAASKPAARPGPGRRMRAI